MHKKIKELEKKWYHYKIKTVVIPLSSIVITASIGSGGYYLYDKYYISHKLKTAVLSATKEANVSNKIVANIPIKVEKSELLKRESSDIILEPIIPVIDMQREEAISHVKKRATKRHNSSKKLVKAKPNDYLTAKELASIARVERVPSLRPHTPKKIKLQITSENYIETIKEKYAHSHSFRDALLLAKAFYKEASYKEAEEWALRANMIDSKSEESWLLFAKSKAKMDKKQEAINILAKYYTKSKSVKAKELIEQIKRGKI